MGHCVFICGDDTTMLEEITKMIKNGAEFSYRSVNKFDSKKT
jgi:hypothetical protein